MFQGSHALTGKEVRSALDDRVEEYLRGELGFSLGINGFGSADMQMSAS